MANSWPVGKKHFQAEQNAHSVSPGNVGDAKLAIRLLVKDYPIWTLC